MSHPSHELTLGSLDLIGRMDQGANFRLIATGDDATWGNPQSVTSTLKGLLRDGARVSLDSWENREAFLRVVIVAGTGDGLADGEAALFAELGKRNELTWTPSGGFAAPTVFDVEWSELDHDFKPVTEALGRVEYGIRLILQPFSRSAEKVRSEIMSAPPPPADPVVVTVDACNSVSGWVASPPPIATREGYVYHDSWPTAMSTGIMRDHYTASLTRSGGVPTSDTPYLIVEWSRQRRNWSSIWEPPHLTINDMTTRSPMQTVALDGQWSRSVYNLSGLTVASMRFSATVKGSTHRLNVRDIKRTDQVPTARATGHQLSRTIEIGGSARTQASMHVWIESGSLGDVLVHSSSTPDGMFSCDPFLPSSTGVPAGGTVTGSEKPLTAGLSYPVPASLFDPDKSTGYMILARLRRSGSGAITTSVQARRDTLGSGAVNVGAPEVQVVTPPSMSSHGYVSLGLFNMPPRRVQGEAAVMQVTVQGADAVLDDLWFVDIEAGSLTWVNMAGASHLWIDSPTIESPLPRVRASLSWEGEGGYELSPLSMGRHDFPPGPLHIYTVASIAQSSKIQLEYFERWHTHARR